MVELTVFFTVIAAASLFVDKAVSAPQSIDVQNLLQSLQKQLQLEQRQVRQKEQLSRADEDEGREENEDEADGQSRSFGSLKKEDVERLLGLAPDNRAREKNPPNRNDGHISIQDLKRYLQQNQPRENQVIKLSPNDLLGLNNRDAADSSSSEEQNKNEDNPNGFSKVYVVLNTEAIKKSRNKDKLNALLSSLLASPPVEQSSVNKKPLSYKGFLLSNQLNNRLKRRLMNRDSSEIYAKEGGGDKDIRPMRPRGESRYRDHRERGGGGGSGGRTAIPYIRHRGDIYERDE